MSRSLSLPLFLLGLCMVRTGVCMLISPWDLIQHTLYSDAAPSTRNSYNDSLLLASPLAANIEGANRVSMTTTAEGEAVADKENTSYTDVADYVNEDGDLSLSEMREILRREQHLIRERRSPRLGHRRSRHGRRGRGGRNSKRWGRERGYKHSKEHRGRRKGSRKSKCKLYHQCPRWWWWWGWGHKHSSSSSSSEEGDGWLPPLWTTSPRPTSTLPTHATSRPTPDTTTFGTIESAPTTSSAVTSGYTFPDGRPLTLEPDAETLRPLV